MLVWLFKIGTCKFASALSSPLSLVFDIGCLIPGLPCDQRNLSALCLVLFYGFALVMFIITVNSESYLCTIMTPRRSSCHGISHSLSSSLLSFLAECFRPLPAAVFCLSMPAPRVYHVAGAHVTPPEEGRRLTVTLSDVLAGGHRGP
jgi:hypothetical protein